LELSFVQTYQFGFQVFRNIFPCAGRWKFR
jgi:hypothetical protein